MQVTYKRVKLIEISASGMDASVPPQPVYVLREVLLLPNNPPEIWVPIIHKSLMQILQIIHVRRCPYIVRDFAAEQPRNTTA
jgi:hypothetical protein